MWISIQELSCGQEIRIRFLLAFLNGFRSRKTVRNRSQEVQWRLRYAQLSWCVSQSEDMISDVEAETVAVALQRLQFEGFQ